MRILVPLDGSELATTALTVAEGLARAQQGELLLLTVGEVAETSTHAASARESLTRLLDDAATRVQDVPVRTRVELAGDAATTIERVAEDEAIDLIVMTTHGRSGLSRLAHGSVADAVLRRARTPVTLVRPSSEAGKRPELHETDPDALKRHLESSDASVALWAAEQLLAQGVRTSAQEALPIRRLMDESADFDRRRALAQCYLQLLPDEEVSPALGELLRRQDAAIREGAFLAAQSRLELVIPILSSLLESESRDVRWTATALAAQVEPAQALPALIRSLTDQDFGVRWVATRALVEAGEEAFVPVLRSLIQYPGSGAFHRSVRYVLERIRPASAAEQVEPLLDSLGRWTTTVQSGPLAADLVASLRADVGAER